MGTSGPELEDVCVRPASRQLRRMSEHFHRYGMVTVTDLVGEATRVRVREETDRLLGSHAERRDLRLATTGFTRRSMSVVPSEVIRDNSGLIAGLYPNPGLVQPLEDIAGEKLYPCPKSDEKFLITRQERRGDTHGWHWGDFSYALIWVVQAPPIDVGGLLQCVPHTSWDKLSPQINLYLAENPIHTYHFASGDVYFLRTDTTLHRTVPLREDATRIILNMTWAGARDLGRDITADDRWWDDAGVSAASAIEEWRPADNHEAREAT
ncbi:L-lysine 4-chlorinase BesD [Streptantibioticus ferralitis]|uniref:ArpA protein n=1 Tax=Streptantibioticus ferralitis TaxID=236510 RepID=A0ABT5YVZ4_9ACTN|nr:L-lysine 4-chlorinase BesD [Streptantibioticus ferralitis]MDF2255511.1 ArpA protein [Streptantibioticus ferralitis]